MHFELLLAGERVKPHQMIALHLISAFIFIAAGAVLYWLHPPTATAGIALMAGGGLLLVLSLFRRRWMGRHRVNLVFRVLEFATAVPVLVLAYANGWLPAIIIFAMLASTLLFAILWEKSRQNKLLVKVDERGIYLPPTARRRFLNWWDAEQVLLRYGTLTINSRENKMYQWTVASLEFDHEEFEAYCRRQIEEGEKKRPKNDW